MRAKLRALLTMLRLLSSWERAAFRNKGKARINLRAFLVLVAAAGFEHPKDDYQNQQAKDERHLLAFHGFNLLMRDEF